MANWCWLLARGLSPWPCGPLHDIAWVSHIMAMASPGTSDIKENKAKSQYFLWPSLRKHTPQLLQYSIGYRSQPFSLCKVAIQGRRGSSHWGSLEATVEAAYHNFFKHLWTHRRCINSQFWRFEVLKKRFHLRGWKLYPWRGRKEDVSPGLLRQVVCHTSQNGGREVSVQHGFTSLCGTVLTS